MKKAYLSIGFQNRQLMSEEIETIKQVLSGFNISLFVFVDTYRFTPAQEKEMMQQAFADIDSADLLIAEVSEKAIGVGIEIGYAVAKQKPVIYLRNSRAEHSTTAAGAASNTISYTDTEDLTRKLKVVLPDFIS